MLTNLPAVIIGVPLLVILVPSTVHFTSAQSRLIMIFGGVLGVILAIEYDFVQRWRYKNSMNNSSITDVKMREYIYMINSSFYSALHMFLHFLLGSAFVGVILFITGTQIFSVMVGVLDGFMIAIFMGLVNMQVAQIIFFNKLKDYSFSPDDLKLIKPYIKNINIKWKFLFIVNFMFLFVIYINMVLRSNILLYIILIAANFLLSYIFLRTITNSLHSVDSTVKVLFEGDFKKIDNLPVTTQDEIGLVIQDFNLLLSKYAEFLKRIFVISNELTGITSQLAATGEEITASSEEVSATVQDIARDMENQSKNTKSAKDDAVKIKALSESVSSKINMAQTASKKANEATTLGLNKVQETMNSFDSIVDNVNGALERIQFLQNRSEQINEILEIITKISEQTDLLALNAAIEAARVGEYGKGFAVVAEEIRELAEQSSQSTERISKLIGQINGDIQGAAEIINSQHKNVGEGKSLMDETKNEFQQISKAITLTVNMIKEIALSSEEQMSSITKYIQSISNISELSERTSSNTEEIAASMEQQTASMQEILSNVQEVDNKSNLLKTMNEKFKETT